MKKYRILAVFFLSAVVFSVANIISLYTAEINDPVQLGNYTHYNGIVFDYFESEGADIEGALAIGGESKIGTNGHFDIGAAAAPNYASVAIGRYDNPNGYPSLLLNGLPTVGNNTKNNIHVYGGPVVLNENLESGYTSQVNQITGTIKFALSQIVNDFFTAAQGSTVNTAGVLSKAQKNPNASLSINEFTGWSVSDRFNNLTDFIPNNLNTNSSEISVSDILVVNIEDAGHVTINSPQITSGFGEYKLIIFNFPNATSANFTGGSVHVDGVQLNTSAPAHWLPEENALLAKYSEKIIWNFPEAESIQIYASGIVGSILSPSAYVEGRGGSINGMLIADSFVMTNGHELHAFSMNGNIFDFSNSSEVPLLGSVILYKIDADQNELFLEGAEFRLEIQINGNWESYSSETDLLITNSYGRITVSGLSEGQYRFVELSPPEGYDLPSGGSIYHEFVIDADNGVETAIVITAENTKTPEPTIDISIKKVEAITNDGLEDAHFELYRFENNQYILVSDAIITDTAGQYTIQGLTEGIYYLFEENAPEGYDIDDNYAILQITVTSVESGLQVQYRTVDGIVVILGSGDILEIPNNPVVESESRVVLTKIGSNGLALSGAKFTLYIYENGDWVLYDGPVTVSVLETDVYGHIIIEGLPNGRYRLVENEVPEGYEITGDSEFEFIIQDGDIKHEKTITNNAIKGSLTIEKADSSTGTALSGAIFALYRIVSDNTMIRVTELTTDANGRAFISDLEQGTYLLEEIKTPDGYQPVDPSAYKFVIGNDGETVVYHHVLSIKNEAVRGSVSLNKVDGDDHNITLPGVEFALFLFDHTNHVWLQQSGSFRTDADGRLEITGLVFGTYKLVEIINPSEGYETNGEEIIFSITSSGAHHISIMLENFRQEELKKDIRLRKIDSVTEELLADAVFELSIWERGQWSNLKSDITTNSQGEVVIEGLAEGKFQLRELQTPAGYIILEEPLTIVFSIAESDGELKITDIDMGNAKEYITISDDTFIIKNTEQPQFPNLIIYKVDNDNTDIHLAGAKFSLYRSTTGNEEDYILYSTVISNREGRLIFPQLTEGFYRLVEVKAPDGYELNGGSVIEFEIRLVQNELVVYLNGTAVSAEENMLIKNIKSGVPDTETDTIPDSESTKNNGPAAQTGDSIGVFALYVLLLGISTMVIALIIKKPCSK